MNPEQARAFGDLVRSRREELGLTRQQLAAAMEVRDSTVTRLEQGKFAAPRPDKLARLADALRLDLADVFATVGYLVPTTLPGWREYLTTKYPDLPPAAVDELVSAFLDVASRYGVPFDQGTDGRPPTRRRGATRPTRERLAEDFGEDFEDRPR